MHAASPAPADQLQWAKQHLPLVADIWIYGASTSFVLLAVLAIVLGAKRFTSDARWAPVILTIGLLWFATIALGAIIIAIVTAAQLQGPATQLLLSPLAFWPAILGAVLLYRIRGRHPLIYGLTEVCLAIVSLFIATRAATTVLGQLTTLVAGVYFLIRGLDNIDKGLPPWARTWWDRIFPKIEDNDAPKRPDGRL